MTIHEREKITITPALKAVVSAKSKKYSEDDLMSAIRNHARMFIRSQSLKEFEDIEIPKLELSIRIKHAGKNSVVVGLTKK